MPLRLAMKETVPKLTLCFPSDDVEPCALMQSFCPCKVYLSMKPELSVAPSLLFAFETVTILKGTLHLLPVIRD